MRITSKGQVTIPQAIRERCGFMPGTEVDFVVEEDGRVVLVEVDEPRKTTRGEHLVRRLTGRLGSGLDATELMKLTRGWDDDDPGLAARDPEVA